MRALESCRYSCVRWWDRDPPAQRRRWQRRAASTGRLLWRLRRSVCPARVPLLVFHILRALVDCPAAVWTEAAPLRSLVASNLVAEGQ